MKGNLPRQVMACEIMTKPVETVQLKDSLRDVARLFTENHIGAAAVVDAEGKPVGVITKTDIVRFEDDRVSASLMEKKELQGLRREPARSGYHLVEDDAVVSEWMTPVIFSVGLETPLKEIALRMVRYGIHHIFVRAKDDGVIAGIVSSFDVLRQVAHE